MSMWHHAASLYLPFKSWIDGTIHFLLRPICGGFNAGKLLVIVSSHKLEVVLFIVEIAY